MKTTKCAFELAQDLVAHFQIANQNLLGGGLSNLVSHGKYHQIDAEYICSQYLDLIPKIELLCTTFQKEIEVGRSKPTEEL